MSIDEELSHTNDIKCYAVNMNVTQVFRSYE